MFLTLMTFESIVPKILRVLCFPDALQKACQAFAMATIIGINSLSLLGVAYFIILILKSFPVGVGGSKLTATLGLAGFKFN